VIALGKYAHGLFSKHDDLAGELSDAGEAVFDRAWRLPVWDEYQTMIESAFADIYNIGGKGAGAITAGLLPVALHRRPALGAPGHRRHLVGRGPQGHGQRPPGRPARAVAAGPQRVLTAFARRWRARIST
jgi:hypothetical protein